MNRHLPITSARGGFERSLAPSSLDYIRCSSAAELVHDIVDATPGITRSILGKEGLNLDDLACLPVVTEDFRIWGVYLDVPHDGIDPVELYVGSSISASKNGGIGRRIHTHRAKGRLPLEKSRGSNRKAAQFSVRVGSLSRDLAPMRSVTPKKDLLTATRVDTTPNRNLTPISEHRRRGAPVGPVW